MKTKLKIIIPTILAIIAVIIAAVCISFTPNASQNIEEMFSTAQKYLVEQNYEQAVAEFNKIIELDPMNADAYLGLAQTYIEMGDTEKAVETLEKGFELTQDERIRVLLDELLGDAEKNEELPKFTLSETAETSETTDIILTEETAETTAESLITTEQLSYSDEELTSALMKLIEDPNADIDQGILDSIRAVEIIGQDFYLASSEQYNSLELHCCELWSDGNDDDYSSYTIVIGDYDGNNIGSFSYGQLTNVAFLSRLNYVERIEIECNPICDIRGLENLKKAKLIRIYDYCNNYSQAITQDDVNSLKEKIPDCEINIDMFF